MNHRSAGRWIFNLLLKHKTRLCLSQQFFPFRADVKCILSPWWWATRGWGSWFGLIWSHLKPSLKFLRQFNSTNIFRATSCKEVCVLRLWEPQWCMGHQHPTQNSEDWQCPYTTCILTDLSRHWMTENQSKSKQPTAWNFWNIHILNKNWERRSEVFTHRLLWKPFFTHQFL